ncbi:hypothetical protein J1N35_023327 [Gossypium stocksii]|uniref:TOD1/MUCI70 glycosyltransferase-like domain-containing protein n=1 Tax=Gossypium stocksii TaxID=47602 RepID=A0A9D3VIT4_9ROSI|nr:hypothetical protein J1N35_023327 [Gossypium stocksii]
MKFRKVGSEVPCPPSYFFGYTIPAEHPCTTFNLPPPPADNPALVFGFPTLNQRVDSYGIRESMNVHCGFVKGTKLGHGTGFDINDNDLLEMEQCHGVVVASAIFGAFDIMHQPNNIS